MTKEKHKLNIPTTAYFSFADLQALNQKLSVPTLRFKFEKYIARKQVIELGSKHRNAGRPIKIYANVPISNATKVEATNDGIELVNSPNVVAHDLIKSKYIATPTFINAASNTATIPNSVFKKQPIFS